jgi:hypothetical protein
LSLSIAFVIFQISDFLTAKRGVLDSLAIGVETILIFIYSFLFLYQEFRRLDNRSILINPVFWSVSGIVFYLAGSFFFNILANNFTREEVREYWKYSYLFDDVKNILFVYSIYLFAKQAKKIQIKRSEPYLDFDHQPI